jgi:hypothetical protein
MYLFITAPFSGQEGMALYLGVQTARWVENKVRGTIKTSRRNRNDP